MDDLIARSFPSTFRYHLIDFNATTTDGRNLKVKMVLFNVEVSYSDQQHLTCPVGMLALPSCNLNLFIPD